MLRKPYAVFVHKRKETRPIGTKLKSIAASDFCCVHRHYRNFAKSSSHIPAILTIENFPIFLPPERRIEPYPDPRA